MFNSVQAVEQDEKKHRFKDFIPVCILNLQIFNNTGVLYHRQSKEKHTKVQMLSVIQPDTIYFGTFSGLFI